jgi:hypothetical protein
VGSVRLSPVLLAARIQDTQVLKRKQTPATLLPSLSNVIQKMIGCGSFPLRPLLHRLIHQQQRVETDSAPLPPSHFQVNNTRSA